MRFLILIKMILIALLLFNTTGVVAENDEVTSTVEAGSKTFYRFCSICHGPNAKGSGMFSDHLINTPPNLTTLSKENNDVFPWMELYRAIDGSDINPEHGTPEMPIWGNQFDIKTWGQAESDFSNVIVRGRIFEILVYLESIQE
ncbi:MAG: cytochrome c [Gammaproteobacteria bacterium]